MSEINDTDDTKKDPDPLENQIQFQKHSIPIVAHKRTENHSGKNCGKLVRII